MRQEYLNWITKMWLDIPSNAYGKCKVITFSMKLDYPNLKRVAGKVITSSGKTHPHWWLKDNDEIVDPTISQFDNVSEYIAEVVYD